MRFCVPLHLQDPDTRHAWGVVLLLLQVLSLLLWYRGDISPPQKKNDIIRKEQHCVVFLKTKATSRTVNVHFDPRASSLAAPRPPQRRLIKQAIQPNDPTHNYWIELLCTSAIQARLKNQNKNKKINKLSFCPPSPPAFPPSLGSTTSTSTVA